MKALTIEIGNQYIKLCEVQRAKHKTVQVFHAVTVPTPENSVEDGIIKDINLIALSIRTALEQEGITSKEVIFILTSTRIATKEVVLPQVKKDKLQDLISTNASEYFPVNIDEYVLSHTVLENTENEKVKNTKALVLAAPATMIKGYADLADQLSLRIQSIDYIGNSIQQAAKVLLDQTNGIIIQIGMDCTIVSIMSNNILQLQRIVPYGAAMVINSLAEQHQITPEEAFHRLKTEPLLGNTIETDDVTGSLRYLINNINRIVEYFTSRYQNIPLVKAFLIGEGAEILGMDDLVSDEINMVTEKLLYLSNFIVNVQDAAQMAILMPYIPNIGAVIDPVNFRTLESIEKEKKTSVTKTYSVILLLSVVASAAIVLFPFLDYTLSLNEKTNLEEDIDKIKSIEKIVDEYKQSQLNLTELQKFYAATQNPNEWLLDFYKTLETCTPTDISFTSITSASGIVAITGNSTSKASVANLVTQMQAVNNITAVQVSSLSETLDNVGVPTVTFTLECGYVNTTAEEESK